MRLNPDELRVTSFTTADPVSDRMLTIDPWEPIVTPWNDPTAATWCYYCPPPNPWTGTPDPQME